MSMEHYEHLDEEQRSRAASLEIAAEQTSGVAEHLVLTSTNGEMKKAPEGGLRGVFSQLVDGEPPKGSTHFYETQQSTFADVTMRFAQWIELGFDTDFIEVDEDDEEVEP